MEKNAREKWNAVAGKTFLTKRPWLLNPFTGNPSLIPRVLDVEKGKLCYVVGTVYMDMPLKPNVMVDIARDVRAPAYCLV